MFSSENNKTILLVILLAAVFFMIVMPWINTNSCTDAAVVAEKFSNQKTQPGQLYQRKCSAQCCAANLNTMWPVPDVLMPTGDLTAFDLQDIVPSNFTCNNGGPDGGPGGCVCMTKDDLTYLQNKGGNIAPNTSCATPY